MSEKDVQTAEFVERLKDAFDEMVVYNDLKKSNFISSFNLPSFMRDWVLKHFQNDEGEIDIDGAVDFIRQFIPKKDDWKSIVNREVNQGDTVQFLAKIAVNIDIGTQTISFALPDFGLSYREAVITPEVWEACSTELLKSEENWGIIEIGYQYPMSDKEKGKIKLVSFNEINH